MTKISSIVRRSLFVAALGLLPAAASYADIRDERVSFPSGTTGTTINAQISGDDVVRYIVGAAAGQTMSVDFSPTIPDAYFNVMAPGAARAMFIGSSDGNHFTGSLPTSGDYVVQVYLTRNAARQNKAASYALTIGVSAGAAISPDFADGNAGGPDFWQVTGISSRLNMRSGPSTGNSVVGTVAAGGILRNLGCQGAGEQRWCHVENLSSGGVQGWVAGRFLVESGGPNAVTTPPVTTGSNTGGTDIASKACMRALAETSNKSLSDIVVYDVIEAEAGIGVMMTLAGAEKPWSCMSDANGNVQGLKYLGEG